MLLDESDSDMVDRSKEFYTKVDKYGGWQQVAAERIHSLFLDVVKPVEMGFVPAKRGYWARHVDADIFQVIKIDALKGGAYGLSYGLSLSYVPYPYAPKLRWHRTLKSVSLDLREQPQVHLVHTAHPATDKELCVASTLLGERCFHEELESGWAICSPRISDWFDTTRSFTGILEKCDEHLARCESGIRYLPGARLVRAFTYAKMGRLSEAKTELETFLDEYNEGIEAKTNLYAALYRVGSNDTNLVRE